MPRYRLTHRHDPAECAASVAAWRGFDSPLRGRSTVSACLFGAHRTWWDVEATSAAEALALLPRFVAERTEVAQVGDQAIP